MAAASGPGSGAIAGGSAFDDASSGWSTSLRLRYQVGFGLSSGWRTLHPNDVRPFPSEATGSAASGGGEASRLRRERPNAHQCRFGAGSDVIPFSASGAGTSAAAASPVSDGSGGGSGSAVSPVAS